MSDTSEQAARLADMFPSVEFAHLAKVLEKEGFDGAINHLLAEQLDRDTGDAAREEAPRGAWEMNEQLEAERTRQRACQQDIFTKTLGRMGAAIKAFTTVSPTTPQVHNIEATTEGGLVQPPESEVPDLQPVVSPSAMSTATAVTHMTAEQVSKAAEETRTALEGNEEAEYVEYKKKLDDLAPRTTVITIIGKPGVGKTNIINAMLGKPLLPTKPGNLQYIVKNQPGEESWYTVKGEQVPLEEKPFKLKELMEGVVKGAEGVVVVKGPKMFPDDMEIREAGGLEGVEGDYVGVIICNKMTAEEIAGYRGMDNVVLVSVGEDMGEDILRVDPKMYLSSLLLQSVGASGPYTGSFTTLREKVNSIRAAIKESREGSTAAILSEISTHTSQKITNLLSIQHACGCDSIDSRPPASSDVPLPTDPTLYTPAHSTYQPSQPYTPAESDYVPPVSTWQPGS